MGSVFAVWGLVLSQAVMGTLIADDPQFRESLECGSMLEKACKLGRELREAGADLKAARLNLKLARETLIPDLRRLLPHKFGSNPSNALEQLASSHFNDWALGLRLNQPIPFVRTKANIRIGRIALNRAEIIFEMRQGQAWYFLRHQARRLYSCVPLLDVLLPREEVNTYSVQGAVSRPGTYRTDGSDSVLDAIPKAGGLSHRAARECLHLLRTNNRADGWMCLFIEYQRIVQEGVCDTNFLLQPGDIIIVLEKGETDN